MKPESKETKRQRIAALRKIVKAGMPKTVHPWVALTERSEAELWIEAHDLLFESFRAVCAELERRESLPGAERAQLNKRRARASSPQEGHQ